MSAAQSRRGRRPAGEDTRGAIIVAARESFAENGYDATSLRAVARAAGVDPRLVHHYFESKAQLFTATMQVPADPSVVLRAVLGGPQEAIGAGLASAFFSLWDQPDRRPVLVSLISAALTTEHAARMLREFLISEVFGRVIDGVAEARGEPSPPDRDLRAGLAAAQMVGVAILRYAVRHPPAVAATPDEIVAWVGPTLQRYLVEGEARGARAGDAAYT